MSTRAQQYAAQVLRREQLSPHLVRLTLGGLDGFASTVDHLALGRNLEAFAFAGYLCELADRLVAGSEPDPRGFWLLDEAIASCTVTGASPHPLVLRRFELGLLDALGDLPALERCSVCGGPAARSETCCGPTLRTSPSRNCGRRRR